jgi:putative toxin-antitoxin system antitoxin component (TIGR02293 family)
MTIAANAQRAHLTPETEFDLAADMFGGADFLKRNISNPLQAHDMILEGIPSEALQRLVKGLLVIEAGDAFEKALGMSERTFQRHKATQNSTLSPEQSSRSWSFARILAKAAAVFGSQAEAESWMIRPAIGLDNRRPLDLLASGAGAEIVREFLDRLDQGVYA